MPQGAIVGTVLGYFVGGLILYKGFGFVFDKVYDFIHRNDPEEEEKEEE